MGGSRHGAIVSSGAEGGIYGIPKKRDGGRTYSGMFIRQ